MGMLDKVKLPRKICPIIFMLDASGSMGGAPIGAVNSAMETILPELISMNDENPDAEIRVAAMSFSEDNKIQWISGENGLVKPENFTWQDLQAYGGTPMGAAFLELERVLHVDTGFMNQAGGSVAPVLFLLSDGEPTDDYRSGLAVLQSNNWYKVAARIAVGYGTESNDELLAEFTKNTETVLHTNDPRELKTKIQFIVITSSMVASSGKGSLSGDTDSDDTTEATAKALQAQQPVLMPDPDEEW